MLTSQRVEDENDTLDEAASYSHSRWVLPHSLLQLEKQWKQRVHYKFYQEDAPTFYVRQSEGPNPSKSTYHPRYAHSRKVTMSSGSAGSVRLRCDCLLHIRSGVTCRRLCCILDRCVTLDDVSPKHLKSYSAHYGASAVL